VPASATLAQVGKTRVVVGRDSDIYGCYGRSGVELLPHTSGPPPLGSLEVQKDIDIAGRYVAVIDTAPIDTGLADENDVLRVWDLRRRRSVDAARTAENRSVVNAVLQRTGSIAWLQQSDASETVYEVHAKPAGGEATLLDSGADIDPTSLALGGNRLYWLRAGAVKSSELR
jgi:hypothetical protein